MNAYEELRHAAETAVADFIGVSDADFIVRYLQRALQTPRRNCDVGTVEEQKERLDSFCAKHFKYADDNPCAGCPIAKDDSLPCVYRFLQMPYEEGETK